MSTIKEAANGFWKRFTEIFMKSIPASSSSKLRTGIATFPLVVLIYDTFLSLSRIKGTSMEPTLYHGDIVVIRKSDGIWQRWTRNWPKRTDKSNNCNNEDDSNGYRKDDDDENSSYRWAIERGQVLAYERDHCRSSGHTGWVRTPPVPVTGNIVVFQDLNTYPPPRWNIKRVIGLGGQVVLMPTKMNRGRSNSNTTKDQIYSIDEYITGMRVVTTSVPAYSIWVEGDNAANSRDSRCQDHGPVSKKMLIGIAEYRVWPPWRFGKLDNSPEAIIGNNDGKECQSRSYWPGRAG